MLLAIAGLFVLPMPWAAIGIVVAAAVEVGEYWAWKWFLRRYRVQTGVEAMPGTTGEVVEACDPEGRVRVRGELWRARSTEPLERGAKIVVLGVDGLTLEVGPR
jgi:membrane protein implicated in regulation of membrane protease activity